MKDVELRLISELMKDSRKSDRALAKEIGVSQPTVTRIRSKMEQERYIKEYTLIPDFVKIGFEVMAVTFGAWKRKITTEEYDKMIQAAEVLNQKIGLSIILVARGLGLQKDILIISVHESYSAYRDLINKIRQLPFSDMIDIQSFMVNLKSDTRYRPLTFSALADYIVKTNQKK